MSTHDQVHDQLVNELQARLIDPICGLLGTDLHEILARRLDDRADMLAAEIADEDMAPRAAAAMLTSLWGHNDPDPEWWRTPLGRACARGVAHQGIEAITQQRAADMLGVTRGTIAQMVARGTLGRHPDGGVLRSAVLGRLASRP